MGNVDPNDVQEKHGGLGVEPTSVRWEISKAKVLFTNVFEM